MLVVYGRLLALPEIIKLLPKMEKITKDYCSFITGKFLVWEINQFSLRIVQLQQYDLKITLLVMLYSIPFGFVAKFKVLVIIC